MNTNVTRPGLLLAAAVASALLAGCGGPAASETPERELPSMASFAPAPTGLQDLTPTVPAPPAVPSSPPKPKPKVTPLPPAPPPAVQQPPAQQPVPPPVQNRPAPPPAPAPKPPGPPAPKPPAPPPPPASTQKTLKSAVKRSCHTTDKKNGPWQVGFTMYFTDGTNISFDRYDLWGHAYIGTLNSDDGVQHYDVNLNFHGFDQC